MYYCYYHFLLLPYYHNDNLMSHRILCMMNIVSGRKMLIKQKDAGITMLRSAEHTETKQTTHLHLCLPLHKSQAKILPI